MPKEKHFHTCIMHKRIATCRVKYAVEDCEDLRINQECLVSESLPVGLCDNFECCLTAKLDDYALKFEEYAQKNLEQKRMIDHFRSILLMPTDYKDGDSINFSGIDSYIMRQYPTWEQTDPDKVIYFIALHKRIADLASQWISVKVQIPKEVEKRKKAETAKAYADLDKAKALEKEKEKKPTVKLSPYEKAKQTYMKQFNMPEADAIKLLEQMGFKP